MEKEHNTATPQRKQCCESSVPLLQTSRPLPLARDFIEEYNTATLPHKKYYDLDLYERRRALKAAKKGVPLAVSARGGAGSWGGVGGWGGGTGLGEKDMFVVVVGGWRRGRGCFSWGSCEGLGWLLWGPQVPCLCVPRPSSPGTS